MKTYNLSPYYDDFDSATNFHQVMFKPGSAVQARELTQLQTILRNQIEKFGDHVFKHGSVVIPGNSRADLNASYIKLQPTFSGNPIVLSSFDSVTLVGTVSGVEANVQLTVPATGADPDLIYVVYTSGSGGTASNLFTDGEEIYVKTNTAIRATLAVSAATGMGSLAFVNRGVYYVNGSFVEVPQHATVLSKFSTTPSARVLLKITESIVDYTSDTTLLDPAAGSYNYAAPGADRVKIDLELTTLPLATAPTEDYIELMRFNVGVLEEHSRYPKYNELEKSLARRTYDESGDYVASGYSTTIKEHLRTTYNRGVYPAPVGEVTKLAVVVSPGKAYIRGFEVESIAPSTIAIDKARTASHIAEKPDVSAIVNYGQFIYVTTLLGVPAYKVREQITLWNAVPTNVSGTQIGTAIVTGVEYAEPNTTTANAVFKIYVSDVTVSSLSSVGGIKFATGEASVLHRATAPVSGVDFTLGETVAFGSVRSGLVGKWERSTSSLFLLKNSHTIDVPTTGDGVVGGSSGATSVIETISPLGSLESTAAIIPLPLLNVYRVKPLSNSSDISYKVVRTLDVVGGSASVSGLTIDPIELSTFTITSTTGIIDNSLATLAPDGLSVTVSGGAVGMKIVCVCTKINQTPRQKTLVATFSETGITPSASIQLTKADVYALTSVVSTIDGDVTNRFLLDNGQRDYAYLRGSLSLTGTLPGGTLTVTYSYFTHSGTGDYFSVDSYETSNLPSYYTNIQPYISSTGEIFDLRNSLDFRPRVGDDGVYGSGSSQLIDVASPLSRIVTSAQTYLARSDTVVINKSGTIEVLTGIPSEKPTPPRASAETIPICTIYLYPYTSNMNDVVITPVATKAYKMTDIAKIESRISNLESFSLITAEESSLLNTTILDAVSGLTRYKSGYLIENFKDPMQVADYYHPSFRVTYDNGEITPAVEFTESKLMVVTNGGTLHSQTVSGSPDPRVLGGYISLPYTEVVFAEQSQSTQTMNVNPLLAISWSGRLDLMPSSQTYTDVIVLPPIFVQVTNVVTEHVQNVINTTVEIPRAWNWEAPAGAEVTFAPLSVFEENTVANMGAPGNAAAFNQFAIDWHLTND